MNCLADAGEVESDTKNYHTVSLLFCFFVKQVFL